MFEFDNEQKVGGGSKTTGLIYRRSIITLEYEYNTEKQSESTQRLKAICV